MIPKIIHFCWFGRNPYPEKVDMCMKTWKKYLPDYEFKLWNEDSFDLNTCSFVKEAYENGKYAFVSDFVRIYALYHYGGIYLDTDIEIKKSFNDILNKKLVLGTDDEGHLTAFMASEKETPYFKKLYDLYLDMPFVLENGKLNDVVNNIWMEELLTEYGYTVSNRYQKLEQDIEVFPDDFFHARSLVSGNYNITQNTYCIHQHTLLWVSNKTKIIRFIRMKLLVPILGAKRYMRIVERLKKW